MTLPPPAAGFVWQRATWGAALVCEPLQAHAQHLFTTKQLALQGADRGGAWALVAEAVGGSIDRLHRIRQVHGATVRVVRGPDTTAPAPSPPPDADAIVTNVPGAILAVQVADCVPLLIADRSGRTAAAIHAGWRGTAEGIAGHTIGALAREFGVTPDRLVVAIGPSIGACCYEVGLEVLEAFRRAPTRQLAPERWFSRTAEGSLRLDLWRANLEQLTDAGVTPDQIYVARLCTRTHHDVFDSYRAAGPRAGRMIAAIRC